MTEKFSKTGLSSGSSWSLFAENTAFEESDGIVERLGNMAESTRLHVEDVNKYGQCPSRQNLRLAVCKQCNKLLLISSIQRHYELKHNKLLSSVKPSPPKRCIPSAFQSSGKTSYSKSKVLKSNNKSFIRIEEVDPNEANVKIEEVPLTIPNFNSMTGKVKLPKINIKKLTSESKKSNSTGSGMSSPQICIQVKGNIKKIPQMKEKEYDVDKHCGVWIPEIEKNCTRSLTCKTHPLSMRRQVPGRSKEFDDLLADHKNRVKAQDNMSNASSSPQSNSRCATPVHSPFGIDKIVFPTVPGPSATNYHKDLAGPNLKSPKHPSMKTSDDVHGQNGLSQQVFVDYISDDVINSSNLPTLSYHPKPIRLNNFGGRQTDCSCRLFSRRMDHFRNATSSMLDRFSNAAFTSVKQTKQSSKVGHDGTRAALQDPLQNGILHKQKNKSGKLAGTKRQLSANDSHQGIIADPLSYAASSKRRHSSELPVVDPFALTNQQQNLSRSLSNPPQNSHLVKVNEFQKPNENGGLTHRIKSGSEFLTNNLDASSNILTANFVTASGNGNVLNSSLNLCQSLGVSSANSQQQQQHKHQRVTSADSAYTSSKLMAAPNVTITQGMIVSLPSVVLQSNQPYSQIKDLISQPTPSRTVQHVASSPTLKQALAESNLTRTLANGISSSPSSETKGYSITYCNTDTEEPAPNVTVTVSPSLTGVLHGHVVSAASSKTTFKRLNSTHNNDATLLQQLIVQQSNRDATHQQHSVASYKQTSNHPTIPQTIPSPKQVTKNLTNIQVSPRQTFMSNPNHLISGVSSTQPIKQLQKMQIQQIQQQQIQSPQFITMHHGYQQQILPKLPPVAQNMNQFSAQQFPPAAAPSSLQFISQGAGNNTLQQQHGGALS